MVGTVSPLSTSHLSHCSRCMHTVGLSSSIQIYTRLSNSTTRCRKGYHTSGLAATLIPGKRPKQRPCRYADNFPSSKGICLQVPRAFVRYTIIAVIAQTIISRGDPQFYTRYIESIPAPTGHATLSLVIVSPSPYSPLNTLINV